MTQGGTVDGLRRKTRPAPRDNDAMIGLGPSSVILSACARPCLKAPVAGFQAQNTGLMPRGSIAWASTLLALRAVSCLLLYLTSVAIWVFCSNKTLTNQFVLAGRLQ